jgi:hypothetical protein
MASQLVQDIFARFLPDLQPITEARRDATPHVVSQPGLTRDHLGDEVFEAAMEERRLWIAQNCREDHLIEPLRNERGVLIGRRYRFADPDEALWFRMRF